MIKRNQTMRTMCQEVVENIISYIDDELDKKTLTALEDHLGVCPECMSFVNTYKKMLSVTGKLKEDTFVTPEVRARLKELLKSKLGSC